MTELITISDLERELLLNLGVAAISSFAGAYGAWLIARRADRNDKLIDEVIATNHAIGLCVATANVLLNLKEQIVLPTLLAYRESFENFSTDFIAAMRSSGPREVRVRMDYQYIEMPQLAKDELQSAIAGVKRNSLAPMLLASITRVIASLNSDFSLRHDYCTKLRGADPNIVADALFGLWHEGVIDETIPQNLMAMERDVEDAIYYLVLMCDILQKHGDAIKRACRRGAPKVSKASFEEPSRRGLMPDPSQYPTFEAQFKPSATPRVPFGTRLKRAIAEAYHAFHDQIAKK